MSNQLQTVGAPKKMSLSAAFATPKFQEAIHNALNDVAHEKRFVSSIVAAAAANPVLQECTPQSVLSTALIGESLGLLPSPQLGQYYFVPFETAVKGKDGRKIPILDENGHPVKKNGAIQYKKVKQAQFLIGYKGYIQLALRSGYYKKLNVISIKRGELIRWDPLMEDIEVKPIEDDKERETAETIGYYAMFEYLNGFQKKMYWSKDKMIAHADRYSPAFSKDAQPNKKNPAYSKVSYADYEAGKVREQDMWLYSSFWYKDFDSMAYKTMLRQLLSKWGMLSAEMETAMQQDIVAEQAEDGTVTINADGADDDYGFGDPQESYEDVEYEEVSDSGEVNTTGQKNAAAAPNPSETGQVKLSDL